jgi:uncharacterized protein (UPF0147 family)
MNNTKEEVNERNPKRSSTEEASSSTSQTSLEESVKSLLETTRIQKKPRTSTEKLTEEEDSVEVKARKALEMFQEIEAEDAVADDANQDNKKPAPNANGKTKQENKKPKSDPRWPKAHRVPIISQRDELLL